MFSIKSIKEITEKYEFNSLSPRKKIEKEILDNLNAERKEKLKPIVLTLKLKHLSNEDVFYLHSMCKEYRGPYGKCFWGSLKPRN